MYWNEIWGVFVLFLLKFIGSKAEGTHEVIKVIPSSEAKLAFLKWLSTSPLQVDNVDFWTLPTHVNSSIDLMVSPEFSQRLKQLLQNTDIWYNVTIDDLDSFIIKSEGKIGDRKKRSVVPGYDFSDYQPFDMMEQYLRNLSRVYHNISRLYSIGGSHEGRNIWVMEIGSEPSSARTKSIWLDAGIHAREWGTHHAAIYIITQLLENYGKDKIITGLVDNLRWYIAPNVNPDGYVYSWSSSDPKVRLWRKNRSPEYCVVVFGRDYCCQGVDLNRNFDSEWNGKGHSSVVPCHSYFHGRGPFSEPETLAIRDFVSGRASTIKAFISLHTYGQLWLYPYSYAQETYPANWRQLKWLARRAANAVRSVNGTQFKAGTAADLLFSANGISMDWAKDQGVKYPFMLELRPVRRDESNSGFFLDKKELMMLCRETWEGIKVVAKQVVWERN